MGTRAACQPLAGRDDSPAADGPAGGRLVPGPELTPEALQAGTAVGRGCGAGASEPLRALISAASWEVDPWHLVFPDIPTGLGSGALKPVLSILFL